ncbi:MAG: hypothetical protein WCS17_12015 [Prevotella sp.]
MTRFSGKVGYSVTEETEPGLWIEHISEHRYIGDVIRNARRLDTSNGVNGDIVINNTISIVADAYAFSNFFAIRYVEWMGTKWKVTNVEVQSPRLILTLGGRYNDESPEVA